MKFRIRHLTEYKYQAPIAEAYGELRLTPPELPTQHIANHRVHLAPETETSTYDDFFGNPVRFFSLPFRHKSLRIINRFEAETAAPQLPEEALEVSIQEARQIFASHYHEFYPYLQAGDGVEFSPDATFWAKEYLPGRAPIGQAVDALNTAIYKHFKYVSGSTDNYTPLTQVWKERCGVCQDFAHLMLSVLRTAGLPSRYVCGYIETDPPKNPAEGALVGAVSTHAWVEVLLPGRHWAPIDPTNNQWVGERHIVVSYGPSARGAAPFRGTFKGVSGTQKMRVEVKMERI
jgi:transglutaminase-like putative cysteine protease